MVDKKNKSAMQSIYALPLSAMQQFYVKQRGHNSSCGGIMISNLVYRQESHHVCSCYGAETKFSVKKGGITHIKLNVHG